MNLELPSEHLGLKRLGTNLVIAIPNEFTLTSQEFTRKSPETASI